LVFGRFNRFKAKNLDSGSAVFVKNESGLDHFGIVKYQPGAFREQAGKLVKLPVFHHTLLIHQQPGLFPVR
jgi:hypothetical protein